LKGAEELEESWEEIGRGVAREIGIDPKSIEYIEARGFLCYELLYLLGGRIEFVFAPWWRIFRRLGDILFGVFPICRWYPLEGSNLEQVGYQSQYEIKVYRLTITQDDQVVFAVKYEPSGSFFPYNVPQLPRNWFLRPPFEKNKELISKSLRHSIHLHEQAFEPFATEEGIRTVFQPTWNELDKGRWEGFIQITTKR